MLTFLLIDKDGNNLVGWLWIKKVCYFQWSFFPISLNFP